MHDDRRRPDVRLLRHHRICPGNAPGHVGTVAGLFFGLSFGMGGLGSVIMGSLMDMHGVELMIRVCAFLPLLGLFALLLPKDSVIMGATSGENRAHTL